MNTTTITQTLSGTQMLSGISWRGPSQPLRSDDELVELFAASGLTVELVEHCGDLSCPACFSAVPAKAA